MKRTNSAIKSRVKDKQLVDIRRQEIVNAAVGLFVKKGYHETTVREIAKEFGMSMGALYDYIRTKEDILFLVCDHIHNTVSNKLRKTQAERKSAVENLKKSIEDYFTIVDEIQDYMLLLYQETKSLSKSARKYIYSAELELTAIFEDILLECINEKSVKLSKKDIKIVAHDIMVTGQMWAFRRWALSRNISLKNYIEKQTTLIIKGIK